MKPTKKKRKKAQIYKNRSEKKVTMNITKIQRMMRLFLCVNKMENLEEMYKFLESYNLPRLKQKDRKYEDQSYVLKLKVFQLKHFQ